MSLGRRAARPLLYAGAAVVLFYLVGGADAYRSIRARIRSALQPPTAEQMTAPALPPPEPLRARLPTEAVRGRMWLSDPPRPMTTAIVLASIVLFALVVMYFTGRVAHESPRARR